jgi:alkylhydroperoxidase/carboxymuconolactone decarboxylase family protein YurZ
MEIKIMTDINYTPEMVATLKAAQPIDYAKAQQLAKQLDRGVRSIIANAICSALDCDPIVGLEKSTGSALSQLLMAIR